MSSGWLSRRRLGKTAYAATAFTCMALAVQPIYSLHTAEMSVPSFVAEGSISRLSYRRGKTNDYEKSDALFHFYYTNGWWEISVQHVTPKHSSLGTQNCKRIPDGVRKFTLFEGDPRTGVTAAEVCPITFPPPGLTHLFATWLMLCPRPELPLIDDRLMLGFPQVPLCRLSILHDPRNRATYALSYLNPAPAFIERLTLTNNGFFLNVAGETDEVSSYPAPYRDGFPEHDYRIISTTNVNGITFPSHAVLKRFRPPWELGLTTDYVDLACLTELTVHRISLAEAEVATRRPAPPRLMALDARPPGLPKGQSVNYLVTNDEWKPVSDPLVQELAAITMAHSTRARKQQPTHSRWSVLLILGIFTTSAGLLLFLTKERNPM